mmetsp:Transcript_4144/g.16047  ORF Transcript_4144/g.16047 Transcript_4144/m.16047 type:complete len:223 (-) Transcript_4144:643-1311(-)
MTSSGTLVAKKRANSAPAFLSCGPENCPSIASSASAVERASRAPRFGPSAFEKAREQHRVAYSSSFTLTRDGSRNPRPSSGIAFSPSSAVRRLASSSSASGGCCIPSLWVANRTARSRGESSSPARVATTEFTSCAAIISNASTSVMGRYPDASAASPDPRVPMTISFSRLSLRLTCVSGDQSPRFFASACTTGRGGTTPSLRSTSAGTSRLASCRSSSWKM